MSQNNVIVNYGRKVNEKAIPHYSKTIWVRLLTYKRRNIIHDPIENTITIRNGEKRYRDSCPAYSISLMRAIPRSILMRHFHAALLRCISHEYLDQFFKGTSVHAPMYMLTEHVTDLDRA